jgi:transposase
MSKANKTPPPPDIPTNAPPGSEEKIAVMESRAAKGQQVFHPEDATWSVNFPTNGERSEQSVNSFVRRSRSGEPRRKFTRAFKVEAVKLVTEQGRGFAEVAANLGIAKTLLRKWKKALDAQGDQTFLGKGNLPALKAVRRLDVDAAEDEERPAAINYAVSLKSPT